MRVIIASLVLVGLSMHQLTAEESPVAPSHEAAARELLEIMDTEEQMAAGAKAMMDAMILQAPHLDEYRDVLLEWAESVLTWEVFGPRFVAMYAEAFSEQELRDLIAFYRTTTGQKAIALLPELTNRAAQMGAIEAQSRQAELRQMIERRTAELHQSNSDQ